jgi:GR25 family glycosyltransferase involved in LPS biosynthesis
MEGVDVIYWINLKCSTERRKHMEKVFKDPAFDSVKNIRINAIDAKHSLKKLTLPIENFLSINHRVNQKEYGCLVSHLEAIRQFSKSTFNTAIILEDDISLGTKPYWHKTIRQVMEEAPKDWEILKLQNTDANQTELYTKLTYPCYYYKENRKINKKPYCNLGTLAYLIHKRAALKLMRMWNGKTYQLPPNTFHVADYILYDILTTYVYKTPYFIVRKDNNSHIINRYNSTSTNRTRRLFLSKMKTRKRSLQ